MRCARTALVSLVLLSVGCGGDDNQPSPGAPSQRPESGSACKDVTVPGHLAVQVRASGVACGRAEAVAAAAEGQGRARYDAEGFVCEPSDAGGADTNYACTAGGSRVTFRYGTR